MKQNKQLLDLKNTSSLVTGAAQGFGFAIARRLAEAGSNVVVADIKLENAQKSAKRISEEFAVVVDSCELDVADESQVIKIFSRYPNIDFLINNAGVFSNYTVTNLSSEEFDRIIRVNVRGVFLCSREFAKTKESNGNGNGKVIVNIASVDALNPSCVGQVHYTSSKHAVAGLTKGLSVELAPKGMRVCAVCPGAALTEGAIELVQSGSPDGIDIAEQWAGIAKQTPMGRLISPDDVALAVLFLVSPMGASITGILLPVDGGITSQPYEGYLESK
ncbi:MAG: SDR family oxidoreductase [Acidimicrobiaceae bacterium]|nr:SDR family oxidoreductase [Acidimicrobiaceae bacterium]